MPLPPAPNIVQVEVRALFDNQKIENRFHINAQQPLDEIVIAEICNYVSIWAEGTYFPQLPAVITLRETVATDLSASSGLQHTITPEGLVDGGLADAPMPNESTFAITLRSGFTGRSSRGRAFVLGLARGDVNGNYISATRANAFVSAFNSLISTLASHSYPLTVVSYYANGALRPGGPVYSTVVSAGYADLTIDSQKRRKPGVGT